MDASIILYLLDGIVFGLVLSLIAAGLTLIYGLAGVLNLAHGELLVVTTVTAAVLSGSLGLPLPLALIAGIAATLAVAVVLDRVVLSPIYKLEGEERVLLGLYITLAFSIFLHGGIITTFPLAYLTLNMPTPNIELLGLSFRTAQVVAGVSSAVILLGIYLFLKKTWTGRAIRSLTQNETGALLVGISVKKYRLLVFMVGAVLVGMAGIVRSLIATVAPESGLEFTILGLLVTVVGGIRSVSGTMAAGLVIGVVYTFLVVVVGTYLAYVALLILIMVLLLTRPYGILGERW
ncbi:MAG: branched-chain amino acid ABC transporter permease [Candidatus Caldarchaeum sp.]|jgi:branched-subunit amino acid ABC-type transport system permease component|uniref:Branched-chain amino acid ABC transporter permease n=1 Tax=Caldiarchaeum subterraneum TaxID=311458 RepID=A0A7C4E1T7_CALS0|nr:branched-chain amino acid ABC transporter permease [Candidatus Caldarchaeales archaeon]MDJ0272607.1 branched-chain amino acid ABC transporter permease [Candidatus Caldarchaeales archaeon]